MENRFSLLILAFLVILWRIVALQNLPISLYVDEAQYWTWAQNLDFGYFSKPPLVGVLIFCSTAFFGDGLIGVKFLAMLCYPATSLLIFSAARRLKFSEQSAFWAGAIVLMMPIFAWLGLVASTDALLSFFWALAFYFFIQASNENRFGDWLLVGLAVGLGLLSKYSMAVFLVSALCYRPKLLKSIAPWCAVLLAFLIVLPNILWNVANDFPTFKHTADITIQKAAAGGFLKCLQFFIEQWLISGGIIFGIFAFLCCKKSLWKNQKFRLCAAFAIPFWAIVGAQAFLNNANANWAAPAFLTASLATMFFLENRRKLLIWTFALEMVIAVLAYHWIFFAKIFTDSPKIIHAPFVRAEGFKELADNLRPLLKAESQRILVANNRTIIAHLRYELRDLKTLKIIAWNPNKTKNNYYQMATDLNNLKNADVFFISSSPLNDDNLQNIARFFGGFEKNMRFTVENRLDYPKRTLFLYKFNNFQGYAT